MVVVPPVNRRIHAAEQGIPGGRAYRVRAKMAGIENAGGGEAVNVRRFDVPVAVNSQTFLPVLVGVDYDYIWAHIMFLLNLKIQRYSKTLKSCDTEENKIYL